MKPWREAGGLLASVDVVPRPQTAHARLCIVDGSVLSLEQYSETIAGTAYALEPIDPKLHRPRLDCPSVSAETPFRLHCERQPAHGLWFRRVSCRLAVRVSGLALSPGTARC